MTDPRFEKPISDLRRRMLQDMTNRNFGDKTKHDYIRHVETLAKFLGRSPDTVTGDDLRRFQAEQIAAGAQPPKMNTQASALRFFLTITCGRADLAHQLARTHYPKKLPRVLSPEDVGRLLEAAPGPGLKYKAALSVAYGAGLRGGEVVMLRVSDIDSKRMLIRVEMGKGRKDRHAMLSPQLLELLRAWWLQCRSPGWLFPGRDPLLPMTTRQLNRACHMAADAAGLGSWVTPHTLRHSLRDASAGEPHRCPRDPGAARSRQARHDGALCAGRDQPAALGREPARPADAAEERATAGLDRRASLARPALEVADIFRDHGPAWRDANRGHVSLGQLKVMSAIESCRTAALGGHVARCENAACGAHAHRLQQLPQPALPEVPGRGGARLDGGARGRAAARALLPRRVHAAGRDRRHRLPEQGRDLRPAVQGVGRDDARRLPPIRSTSGARIAITSVLHTWGSAMTHHPHVHMIVPGGGIVDGWHDVDRQAPELPPAREGAVAAVPPADAREADSGARRRQAQRSLARTRTSPTPRRSTAS